MNRIGGRGTGGGGRAKLAAAAALAALLAGGRPAAAQVRPGPAWTNGATCYEIFVRSFQDSNGDGTGDFNGLTQRLGYVDSLGAKCIWLMPMMPSPSYHGYDVSDYYAVNPQFGTMDDFRRFVAEAHRRGIRILIDMVLNHTSDSIAWFQAALRDTASPYRSWYRFSPTDLGRGPWGAPAWHKSPLRDEYYYGVFYRGMPDLNYDTPAVREEAKKIATFWLRDVNVDGFRLDAIPYLVEQGSCMSGCPGTHRFLHEYQVHLDSIRPDVYTVGEASWANLDSLLPYYPDQLTANFAFGIADSLIEAVRRGTAGGVLYGYLRLQDTIPGDRIAPFVSNHDRPRVMTLLHGDQAKMRVAATLLLTLPGMPFVYYGDEIGMQGDKPDPRIRTPMQWTAGSGGFTTGRAWIAAQPDSATLTVAAQERDPGSLLNLYRRLIHLRSRNVALGTGRLTPLTTLDSAVVAYVRGTGPGAVLVAANLGATRTHATLGSPAGLLPPGRYAARSLLGGPAGAALTVGADGRIRGYAMVLGPGATRILELTRR